MPNYPGSTSSSGWSASRAYVPGWPTTNAANPQLLGNSRTILQPDPWLTGPPSVARVRQPSPVFDVPGNLFYTYRNDWFNKVHIIPRSIAFGNILSSQTRNLDVYNAYLPQSVIFSSFVNNAGTGTSITNLPSLPATILPQEGLLLTLQVTPDGVPQFNATLDFGFNVGTSKLPVTGSRIVLFPFRPETPLIERLRFLTDILEHKDGTEQRISLRKAPRQEFDLTLLLEDGPERQRYDNLMFDWQARVFGLPMWHEPTFLASAASAGATSINVGSTDFADYRVGGLAVIYSSETSFETIEITSVGPTAINFSSPLASTWPAGTEVYPVRTAICRPNTRKERYPTNLQGAKLTFRVLDNDVSLASTAAFNTLLGKVILDDANAIDGTLQESIDRRVYELDSETGKFSAATAWSRSRSGSAKTFVTRTRQRLWEVRQLLHALRGPQTSFYLPTFYRDLTPAVNLVSGNSTITIVNVGYSRYAKARQPKNQIRVWLANGTSLDRTVTAAAEVDASTEQLTVDTPWPSNIAVSSITRVELVEKVRIDGDDITIEHRDSLGSARIGFPVRSVLE